MIRATRVLLAACIVLALATLVIMLIEQNANAAVLALCLIVALVELRHKMKEPKMEPQDEASLLAQFLEWMEKSGYYIAHEDDRGYLFELMLPADYFISRFQRDTSQRPPPERVLPKPLVPPGGAVPAPDGGAVPAPLRDVIIVQPETHDER